jgi:hypothetical protein
MRRAILLAGVLSIVSAFIGGLLTYSLVAPPLVAAQAGQQLNGTWLQTLDPPGAGGGNALVTFSSDGTVIISTANTLTLQAADGVHRLTSVGHGNWVRISGREFAATWRHYRWNAETAQLLGTIDVSCVIRLNEALDEYTCDQQVDYFDPTGDRDRPPTTAPTIAHRMPVEMPT